MLVVMVRLFGNHYLSVYRCLGKIRCITSMSGRREASYDLADTAFNRAWVRTERTSSPSAASSHWGLTCPDLCMRRVAHERASDSRRGVSEWRGRLGGAGYARLSDSIGQLPRALSPSAQAPLLRLTGHLTDQRPQQR
jgi:hypothetical protein